MNIEKARVFLQVAASGSLSRTAVMLDTQQSVISRSISAFERDIGGALFHRTGRGVTLTELGERLVPRIRALVLEADQLAEEIRGTAGLPGGDVRVGILPSMSHPLVTQLFQEVRQRYPAIRLRIDEGSGGQLAEWVANGSVDMAILFRASGVSREDATLLRQVSMHLVGPAGDALTALDTVPFVKLHQIPLVLPGARSGLRAILEQLAQRKKIVLQIALEADSLTVQKDVVADGAAYTVLAMQAVHREIAQRELQAARIVAPAIDRALALSTTRQHPLTLGAREVARIIRQLVEKMPLPAVGTPARRR
ncbi:LysR substrate-binding domain-containing protein [Caenimonas soli]|uniref:LysR substrate-binding domain-containing protein n=1 Tax=Caenimonas soli TaxID=2735555 RepID=UPI0015568835|nr:LysR substrate-binding domain-containing protein [Caenimonas soli]NPC58317.1 LysR family transcriptional regulator [Caenimonas soli]